MDNNNKRREISVVVVLIAAVSLLSLGAVAAITPAYAGGNGGNGDGIKQKAEAVAHCDQKNKVIDGSLNVQDNIQPLCAAISANINDFALLGGLAVESSSEASSEEFSAPSTP